MIVRVHKETLSTGEKLDLSAQVGLLTRNIKIVGGDYPNMQQDSYGVTVKVGMTSMDSSTFTGYARISNVEFYRFGHEGYVDPFDPRYALAFSNLGDNSPSYVRNSTFHNGFSPAIGVYGTNDLLIENNVIHHTVWFCMETTSDNTTIRNNLFALHIWEGSYQNRYEPGNVRWHGCIEAITATNLNLTDNVVTASERFAYHIPPQDCSISAEKRYANNKANTALICLGILPLDPVSSATKCALITGVTAWKCLYYGFYYNNMVSVVIDRVAAIECGIGVFEMLIGPNPITHVAEDRHGDVNNSLIVGTTSSFDCTVDQVNQNDDNIKLSSLAVPFKARQGGKGGIAMIIITGGPNSAPEKPFAGIMSYPALLGFMVINRIGHTLVGLVMIGTISFFTQLISTHGSPTKIIMQMLRKINSADCVDMDCDGLKKVLIFDEDGTLIDGTPSTIISWAEYEWDGDPRRGLGDYRIPKTMLTSLNGDRISVNQIAPHKAVEFLLHFSSTPPKDLRFHLMTRDENATILMKVWYPSPNRKDVYVNGQFVTHKNGYYDASNRYLFKPASKDNPNEYVPDMMTDRNGANYYDRNTGLLYILVQGSDSVTIKTADTVIVSFLFEPLTVDEFFGEQIVMHVCSFFNLPLSKCRLVDIVSASQSSGRRRRRRSTSESSDQVVVEIANEPTNSTNGTVGDPDQVSTSQINDIGDQIVTIGQTGGLSSLTNSSNVLGMNVGYIVIVPVHSLCFVEEPVPEHEVVPFKTQPKIRACDDQGQPISILGTSSSPWIIKAELKDGTGSNSASALTGNDTVQFVDGWANFTDLALSQSGSGFVIEFSIISPASATNYTIDSTALTINNRKVKMVVITMATEALEFDVIPVFLELRDEITNERIEDIGWRGHVWTTTVELGPQSPTDGVVNGTTSSTFDNSTSQTSLSISLSSLGTYVVKFRLTTSPAEYDIYTEVLVTIKSQAQVSMVIEDTKTITMKFDGDYNTIVGTGTSYNNFIAWVSNWLMGLYQSVVIGNVKVSPGSIIVTFTVNGSLSGVNETIFSICGSIENGQSVTYNGQTLTLSPYLNVGRTAYYGVSCGPIPSSSSGSESFPLAAIIAIAVTAALILIVVVIFVVLWKCKVAPKSKTHAIGKAKYFGNETDPIDEILFREKTFMSIRDQIPVSPIPPLATIIDDTRRKKMSSGHSERSRSKSTTITPPPAYTTVIRVATPVEKPLWKY
ncbi:hypothetical protein KUTeg_009100 [Tegillarca granosa]|uniref:CEMIP beta-helix domain-containing protein n=1 Tax=Tegillarca granosa TaxID=220873 RepID=A0ABQ9F7G2_TEGGR|nr:hypothetical protein KUTeg_009100 [Tegillarca granosa]